MGARLLGDGLRQSQILAEAYVDQRHVVLRHNRISVLTQRERTQDGVDLFAAPTRYCRRPTARLVFAGIRAPSALRLLVVKSTRKSSVVNRPARPLRKGVAGRVRQKILERFVLRDLDRHGNVLANGNRCV